MLSKWLAYLLLEERDQEVDGQHGVLHDVVFRHVDVSDSDTETEDLLQLELDGRLDFGDLSGEILRVRDGGGEFTSLGETGTQESDISLSPSKKGYDSYIPRNLLDQSLGSEESIVLLCELLDELLVLKQSALRSKITRLNPPC